MSRRRLNFLCTLLVALFICIIWLGGLYLAGYVARLVVFFISITLFPIWLYGFLLAWRSIGIKEAWSIYRPSNIIRESYYD